MNNLLIRPIQLSDNAFIAKIIRESLTEFGANKPGTVYYDDSTDHLYELCRQEGSVYYVAEKNGEIIGGAGIYPSKGLPPGVCELVKMYLKKEARGAGLGRMLINKCVEFAELTGYEIIYLETMPELKNAVMMYKKYGFEPLAGPIGDTGHFGCDVWMTKNIKKAPE